MNPYKVSAQFAAFNWYLDQHPDQGREAATQFARDNWVPFLTAAHEGVGRLLIAVGKRHEGPHGSRNHARRPKRELALAN